MTPSINIVVIDDHPLLREGVSSTLQAVNEFEVVGEGENYADALRLVHETMPDIILLDISLPESADESEVKTFDKETSVRAEVFS